MRAVRDAAERLVRRGVLEAHPTFFEVLTAAAFAHFRRRRVDVAVLEVGLGGRLDATNVAEPLASAIVSIDFDHEVYLGRTLAAIAGEKAGVLRPGRPTVIGPLPDEARRAVRARAREIGARVVEARRGARFAARAAAAPATARPAARSTCARRRPATRGLRPLPGAHQRDNLLVAIRLLEEAKRAGLPGRPAEACRRPSPRTRWPGRLERVPGDPPLLLDGAHNPAGARALAAHLAAGRPSSSSSAAMADKDVRGLARELFPLAARGRPHAAAHRARGDARRARPARRPPRRPRPPRAERRPRPRARPPPRARARPGHRVVVAGSLYLVGAVKALLERERR